MDKKSNVEDAKNFLKKTFLFSNEKKVVKSHKLKCGGCTQ
jgi:hypothetical protein